MFAIRERHARRLDRPVFKVIGNDALYRLAQRMPASVEDVRTV